MDFTIQRHEINFSNYGEPIYLVPFGDIHRYSPCCAEDKWLDFLDWAKKKENCYFIGMGDYDDFMSTSERKSYEAGNFHESTMESIDDYAKKRTYDFVKEIEFMKGKVIGLIEGNHTWKFESGVTSTQLMCEYLNCKYLGVSSFIRLSFSNARAKTRNSVDIWAHHGLGGARMIGGSINSVQRMQEIAIADIYLCGHDHKKWVALKNQLQMTHGQSPYVKNKKILLGRTGSFLQGYVPGKKSYVARKALPPTDLGVIKIELTPKRERKQEHRKSVCDNTWVDIHASI